MRDMTHSYAWDDSFKCVRWLIHMCKMTRLHMRHDSIICVRRLIHMCETTHSYVWDDEFICVTWLSHMYKIAHSYVWDDSVICVTWLIHMCDMTHPYVWHDSVICVTWLIHMSILYKIGHINSYMWHDALVWVHEFAFALAYDDSFIYGTRLIHMSDMTHSCVWHDGFMWAHLQAFIRMQCLRIQQGVPKRERSRDAWECGVGGSGEKKRQVHEYCTRFINCTFIRTKIEKQMKNTL